MTGEQGGGLPGTARRAARAVLASPAQIRRILPEPVADALRAMRRHLPDRVADVVDRAVSPDDERPSPDTPAPSIRANRQPSRAGGPRPARHGDPVTQPDGEHLPPRPVPPQTDRRLWVGPVNYAGQGHEWARAVEQHVPGVGARSMAVRRGLRFPVDYEVPPGSYRSLRWQRAQEKYVLEHYTDVLIEAERPLFGTLYGDSAAKELPTLRRAGLNIALICHGSDVRLPSRHAARFAHSPFADQTDPYTARLEAQAARNLVLLGEVADPVFVSTPDLLDDVPRARWCPVVIDPEAWVTTTPLLHRRVPRVVHIPSNGPLKGSDLVDPTMRDLAAQGRIDYQSLRGLSHEQVRDAYRDADIVLDQFVLGLYGVAAAEAMAAGRVVVAYVTDPVRRRVAEATGLDVPIVEADPDTVRDVVLGLLDDRDRARSIAAAGPAFVQTVHDGRFSARVLSAMFALTAQPAPATSRWCGSTSPSG